MKFFSLLSILALLLFGGEAVATKARMRESEEMEKNPMRRIISMLMAMESKVEKEREVEKATYEKAMCTADEVIAHLTKKVDDANKLIPQLEASIEENTGAEAQLARELTDHKADLAELTDAMEEAKMMRGKENSAFKAESAESKANIAACKAAVTKLEEGLPDAAAAASAASFLQSDQARVLKKAVMGSSSISEYDRTNLVAFLTGGQRAQTADSNEILGMLKQLHKDMIQDLKDMTEEEEKAVKQYDDLMAAKGQQAAEATQAIEKKTTQQSEVQQQLVDDKSLLKSTQGALKLDTENLIFEKKAQKLKTKEYEERERGMAVELEAISGTMKMLNNDDAMNVFKKSLAHPDAGGAPLSFLQSTERAVQERQARGLAFLRSATGLPAPAERVAKRMVAMAVKSRTAGFEKVLKMIDDMVSLLKEEQQKDADKKEYCDNQLAQAKDKKELLEGNIEDVGTEIASTKDSQKALREQVADLKSDITSLDEEVAKATAVRKEENAEFQVLLADNAGAIQLIEMAKEKFSSFFGPPATLLTQNSLQSALDEQQQQQAAPVTTAATSTEDAAPSTVDPMEELLEEKHRSEQTQQERPRPHGKAAEMEDLLEEAVSFVQTGSRASTGLESSELALERVAEEDGLEVQDTDADRLEVQNAEASVLGASPATKDMGGGVIKMFNEVKRDLEKEIKIAEHAEKDAKADFEQFLDLQGQKRADDQRSIVKISEKLATADETHQQQKGVHEEKTNELSATTDFLADLHTECDTLLANFDMRKSARTNEINGLTRAKAVLAGADDKAVTFLQTGSTVRRHEQSLRR